MVPKVPLQHIRRHWKISLTILKTTSLRKRHRSGSCEICVQCPKLRPTDQTSPFTPFRCSPSVLEVDKSIPLNLTMLAAVTDQAVHCFSAEYCGALWNCWLQTVHAGAPYTILVTVSCVSLKQFHQLGFVHTRRSDGSVTGSWGRTVGTNAIR